MRSVKLSEDFVPVSELKSQAAAWLRRIAATGAPVIVTQNGRPAGVLLSPRSFDELTRQASFVASVEAGIADADAGRVHSHAAVARKLKRRLATKG